MARDLSVSLDRLGDFYLRRGESGDAGRALASYEQSMDIAQRLYAQNPDDAQAARDLSVSLGKLGDLYLRRGESGDAGRALASYEQCHKTLQRLYEQNSNDAQAARDLTVSLDRLGDSYLRRGESGDAGRALTSYEQCHKILQRLYEQNPNDAQVVRDLAVSHFKMYRFAQDTGQDETGMPHLRACHQILRDMHRRGMFLDPPALDLLKQLDDALG